MFGKIGIRATLVITYIFCDISIGTLPDTTYIFCNIGKATDFTYIFCDIGISTAPDFTYIFCDPLLTRQK